MVPPGKFEILNLLKKLEMHLKLPTIMRIFCLSYPKKTLTNKLKRAHDGARVRASSYKPGLLG